METKSLLYGLIGFLLGGLLVSIAATTFDKPSAHNEPMNMSQMTDRLKNLEGDEFDKAFIIDMIAHHQAAVDMAKLADSRAKHQEIKDLSNDIISAQEKEITAMRQWQVDWDYANSHSMH